MLTVLTDSSISRDSAYSGSVARTSRRLVVGVTLIATSWTASWTGETLLAHHSFFPLWLGYILTLDALTEMRAGTSLWTRGRSRFVLLFVASVPLWWLFEAFNARLENWSYLMPREYSWIAYRVEASIAFSTVVPALFVTAELYRALGFPGRFGTWIGIEPGTFGWAGVASLGAIMIVLVLAVPALFFPLVWIGVFFLIDPVIRLRGGWSIATQVELGWWGTVWRLFAAGITCGFFWEMWNSRAMPKWIYDIPYADAWNLFEMPLLGYGGYLPFALETYAMVMLANHLLKVWPAEYFGFDRPEPESATDARA